ncbi:MAG: DUF859 family phage minor structural protein [Oscillospiraceae bacterium]|nr:DUF859 family phage minor structural protein [Oscillospiraceae bacterium]
MALYTTISVSPSSREINGSNAFTVSIAYSSTASRLINTKVTVAGQTYSIGTVTTSSFTWTPPLGLLNAMPSLSSATVTITGTPANSNNFSLVGEISTYCTVTVPASYVPTAPTGVSLTRVDNGVPSGWGVYVQNKSRMNVSWSAASGTGGATISQYRIYTDTNSGYYTTMGTSYSNLGPFAAGAKTVTVVAVDSRGRTASSSGVAYTVEPYSVPGVSAQKVDRTTSAGVVDNLGTYMKATLTYAFASVGGKNSATATFAYKTTSSGSYSAETAIAQSTPVIFGGSFSSLTAYHVRFTVTDALGSVTTYVATVESLKIALEFESNSNRLWVHCPLTANQDMTFNSLVTSGGNSHLMLNGLSYISLRTGGTERGYFHSGGFQVVGALATTGAVSGNSLAITNGITCNNLEAYNTITCQSLTAYSLISSGSSSHLYLRGASYISLQTGTTERGYFHSGGLVVHGWIDCANLSVTNPPWPTSSALPANPSFSTVSCSSDGNAYQINGYSMLDLGYNAQRYSARVNYGLRSYYACTLYAADYCQFYIGNTERAYVSSSGINNSSIAEQKEDIQSAGSALAIVQNARLYKFRYTVPPIERRENPVPAPQAMEDGDVALSPAVPAPPGEPALSPERLGFVIGEGYDPPPECVLAEDGRGVNLYAMASVCWRGLQELAAKVAALEKR